MPETRYVEIYKDGQLIDKEPYVVSDADLEQENAGQTISELFAKADNEITVLEMAKFLKALARLK